MGQAASAGPALITNFRSGGVVHGREFRSWSRIVFSSSNLFGVLVGLLRWFPTRPEPPIHWFAGVGVWDVSPATPGCRSWLTSSLVLVSTVLLPLFVLSTSLSPALGLGGGLSSGVGAALFLDDAVSMLVQVVLALGCWRFCCCDA